MRVPPMLDCLMAQGGKGKEVDSGSPANEKISARKKKIVLPM